MLRAIAVTGMLAFGVTSGVALADSPNQGGYASTPVSIPSGPTSGNTAPTQSQVLGAHATSPSSGTAPAAAAPTAQPTAAQSAGGGLPFTGLDVGIVALVAMALMGLGLGLRRATRVERGEIG